MKTTVPVVLALALIGVVTSSLPAAEAPAAKAPDPYPYLIPPLPADQLATLRKEFAESSEGVCADLNEYGFTTATHTCQDNTVKIDIDDEDAVIKLVGKWLIAHSQFTGITPKSQLLIGQMTETKGCMTCTPPDPPALEDSVIAFRIAFNPEQLYDLPVEGDLPPMVAYANARGPFRIDGFWLPVMRLPLDTTLPVNKVSVRLIGITLTVHNAKGKPLTHLVDLNDLRHPSKRVVFVKQSSQGLEVRVAWKIPVGQERLWTVYMDAITGEMLRSEPPKGNVE